MLNGHFVEPNIGISQTSSLPASPVVGYTLACSFTSDVLSFL